MHGLVLPSQGNRGRAPTCLTDGLRLPTRGASTGPERFRRFRVRRDSRSLCGHLERAAATVGQSLRQDTTLVLTRADSSLSKSAHVDAFTQASLFPSDWASEGFATFSATNPDLAVGMAGADCLAKGCLVLGIGDGEPGTWSGLPIKCRVAKRRYTRGSCSLLGWLA